MRSVSIVLALAMVMATSLAFMPSTARALEPPKLSITIEAGVGSDPKFSPATIVLPSVPIILNVTLVNNQTGPGQQGTQHTFSIRDSSKATNLNGVAARCVSQSKPIVDCESRWVFRIRV